MKNLNFREAWPWVARSLFFAFLLTSFNALGQKQIAGVWAYQYSLPTPVDTVGYIQLRADTLTPKPTMLFLQGSLPVPLIVDFEQERGLYRHVLLPFDYAQYLDEYHIVVIAMPHTPILANSNQLDGQYCVVTDKAEPNSFSSAYLRANVLDNYVRRTLTVLRHLQTQPWVDADNIHIVGHSQGAKIAAVVAAEEPSVASVSLLSFNPYGRFDERVRKERESLKLGRVSPEEYRERTDQLYERWQHIVEDSTNFMAGNNAWISFSIDYTPFLLKIEMPVLVAYGTADLSAENCDLLPLKFIRAGKNNLTLKPYPNWDHNFFDPNNRESGPNWDLVMNEVVLWIKAERETK